MCDLILDAAGNLYGTTHSGGNYGNGTVFEVKKNQDGSWTEKVLHHFTGGNDGSQPVGGLISDQAGNLYGTTTYGGTYGNGVVFKLTPNSDGSWAERVLHSFTGGADGGYPNHPDLVFDAAGNLYGATASGGEGNCSFPTTGCGVIFELTANSKGNWTEQVLHRFSGGNDGAEPEATLIFDKSGNLYGTTVNGGVYGYGVVFELTPNSDATWTEKVLHPFTGGTEGAASYGGVISDAAGNLYGTTFHGGTYSQQCESSGESCGTVFELMRHGNDKWTEKVLHLFGLGTGGDNPYGRLVFDAAGNLYSTTSMCVRECFGTVFEITP